MDWTCYACSVGFEGIAIFAPKLRLIQEPDGSRINGVHFADPNKPADEQLILCAGCACVEFAARENYRG